MIRPSNNTALDIGPLSWVIDEVRASLGNSIAALKAFAGNVNDSTQLRYAKNHLHQAHGALQIVDLDGIALITGEAERLFERFDVDPHECDSETVNLVERAFGGLLDYLDDLLAGSQHQPIRLYPHYRDLLKRLGADRIHPADLLFPETTVRVADDAQVEAADATRLAAARARFERGLLRFLRNQDGDAAVADMTAAVRLVRGAQQRGPGRSFWTVMDGLCEAQAAPGAVSPDINLKRLFARINLQMRRTIEGSGALAERLLKDALFYVALSDAPAPAVARVRDAYGLVGAVPRDYESTRYGRIDNQLLKRAKDQLSSLKASWDRLMAGQVTEAAGFQRQTGLFVDLCQQLREPTLVDIARAMTDIAAKVVQMRAVPPAQVGMETATAVLFVENGLETFNRLDEHFPERAVLIAERLRKVLRGEAVDESVDWLAELARRSHERSTMATLVAEIQTNLRAIEQTLDAFFRDNNKRDALITTLPLLDQTAGALLLLDHQAANAAIEFGRAAIMRFQQPGYVADQREFERVAQSFGALGFFVDALRQPDTAARPSLEFDPHEGAFVARMTVDDTSTVVPFDAYVDTTRTATSTVPRPTQTSTRTRPSEHELEPGTATTGLPPVDFEKTMVIDFAEEARQSAPAAGEELPLLIPEIDFDTVGGEIVAPFNATSVERETQDRARNALEVFDLLKTQPANDALRSQLRDELTEVRQGAELLDDAKLVGAARSALSILAAPLDDAGLAALNSTLGDFRTDRPAKEAPSPDASTLALAASDDAVIDAELLSIFLAEAREVFETIDAAREKAMANPANQEHLTTLRRAFHTLKGSSRMVGLRVFGEGAWAVEQVFNLWLSEERAGTPALFGLASAARDQMAGWIDMIESGDRRMVRPEALIAAAERVKAGEDFFLGAETGEAIDAPVSATPSVSDLAAGPLDLELEPGEEAASLEFPQIDFAVAEEAHAAEAPVGEMPAEPVTTTDVTAEAEPALESAAEPVPVVESAEEIKRIGDLAISAQLYSIYLNEADERLRALSQEFSAWRLDPVRPVTERAVRSAHSLSGSSATAGVGPVHDVAVFLEQILVGIERAPVEVLQAEFDKLDFVVDRLRAMLHQFAAGFYPTIEPAALSTVDELRVAWQMRQQTPPQLMVVAGTDMTVSPDASAEAGQTPAIETVAVESFLPAQPVIEPGSTAEPVVDEGVELVEAAAAPVDEIEAGPAAIEEEDVPQIQDEIDPELLEIFVAEANDYLPRIGANLRTLAAEPTHGDALADLLRQLHTVKGSARMAGAMRLGARLHAMETRAEQAREQSSSGLYEDLLGQFDEAVALFDGLTKPAGGESASGAPVAEPTPAAASVVDLPMNVAAPGVPATPAMVEPAAPIALRPVAPREVLLPVPSLGANAVSAVPGSHGGAVVDRQRSKSGAQVRVRSEVLDRLVNQAGEVAIARSRLENDLTGVRGALGDLTENVGRLRMQLREVEIAAEAQMQSRIEAQKSHGEDFDPLEFDRYTRLQELTRMMAESVNDVAMVQQNIVRSLEGAGKDLTNQQRLTRDLQQELMRVRMVPVDSVSDRLYRIVRQSAKETGKRATLSIVGGNVELDRGVLERMVGPFEHLLRNAVVHGIESKHSRLDVGKPEAGNVTLSVRHEGNEVVLEFADDGSGLDLDAIRNKAVQQGLLAAPDAMSDPEAAALIFEPGFSTANEITELAGRGVGMDVVHAEAASLGGRVEVQTATGRGTRFSIRLPLTLAVTQVVLVRAGNRVYALPSVLIDQVQQLRPPQIAGAYNDGNLVVMGERVDFVYLPLLLGDTHALPVVQRYSPVVAVRSGPQRVALHVDEVIGNQEVVVKNVGPQLARMIGIAGATVLGSGDIVLILDPVQLVGRVNLRHHTVPMVSATGAVGEIVDGARPPRTETGMSHAPVVMVVDDSVTVRRVTQRLLAREGYQVVLAKDGVDALEQMQDFPPDIMLVDIEMPRMDGFDLTRNVRTDPRFKKIPIVMITSRTADKHRNMAMSLGVNVYLGKPYQEDELLTTVKRFVGTAEGAIVGN